MALTVGDLKQLLLQYEDCTVIVLEGNEGHCYEAKAATEVLLAPVGCVLLKVEAAPQTWQEMARQNPQDVKTFTALCIG